MKSLTLGWLYPELMSTYGDRGNIAVFEKKAKDLGIDFEVLRINQESNADLLDNCDLIFMGGAQDLQQEIVSEDLKKNKGEKIRKLIANDVPGLFICGAYQFLGNYFLDSYGTRIPGLGIFNMYTKTIPGKPRLIGNIVIKPNNPNLLNISIPYYVGFENHGGRTYLADKSQAFARVVRGYGNNRSDKTEGIHFKNAIGTYLHGPILPSNPELANYLLKKAYENKYKETIDTKMDDYLSRKAKANILRRLKLSF